MGLILVFSIGVSFWLLYRLNKAEEKYDYLYEAYGNLFKNYHELFKKYMVLLGEVTDEE